MNTIRHAAREAAEDIFFGQVVINWARWFIIVAGVVLILWTGADTNQLIVGILPLAGLIAMNFYLHARHMAERPANPTMITLASLMDVVLISLVVIFWTGDNGLGSPFFIMYYPAVLAFAFVMPPRSTSIYTILTLAIYTGACALADSSFFGDSVSVEALILRLITLGTMGGLGAFYWRIQRARRRTSMGEASSAGNLLEDQ